MKSKLKSNKLLLLFITIIAITTNQAYSSCPNCPRPNYSPGKHTVEYFGVPQTYNVTAKDQAEYLKDAHLHRDWDEDDIFDKMYYDRPKGAIQSYYAGRVPDEDFDNVY